MKCYSSERQETLWDLICDMTLQEVVDNLVAKVPYKEYELRETLMKVIIEERNLW